MIAGTDQDRSTSSTERLLLEAAVERLRVVDLDDVVGAQLAESVGVDASLITHHFGSVGTLLSIATATLAAEAFHLALDAFEGVLLRARTLDDLTASVREVESLVGEESFTHIARLVAKKVIETRDDPVAAAAFGGHLRALVDRQLALTELEVARGWVDPDFPAVAHAFFQIALSMGVVLEAEGAAAPTMFDHFRYVTVLRGDSVELLLTDEVAPVLEQVDERVRRPLGGRAASLELRRDAVLAKCAALMAERGPYAVGMRELGLASGESVSTLYRWFGSRAGLFVAVGAWRLAQMGQHLAEILEEAADRAGDDVARLSLFAELRWEFMALLALHDPANGFDLFAVPEYRELRRLATQLIGPECDARLGLFAEVLWIARAFVDVSGMAVPEGTPLAMVRLVRDRFR